MTDWTDFEETPPEAVRFSANSLCSKFGFGDGDELSWVKWIAGIDVDKHKLLAHIVRTRLVPLMPGDVELVEIGTCHNPIRAEKINGIEVDWYAKNQFPEFEGIYVELTGEEIVEIAKRFISSLR